MLLARVRTSGPIIDGDARAELCPLTAPGDLAGGDSKWFLFCPMPQHEPQGDGHAGDWRVWWVRAPRPHATQTRREAGRLTMLEIGTRQSYFCYA